MKVIIALKKLHSQSSTRGIGVYTRELIAALQKSHPKSKFIAGQVNPEKLNGQLVHYPYFDPFFLTLKILRGIPTVITIHDLIPLKFSEHFPVGIKGKLKWWLQRRRARSVDHIITDSESSKADIVKIIGVESPKVTVIPLGPNRSQAVQVRLTKKIAASYHLPEKYLLYVGDINWNKNVTGLIETFKSIKDPDLHLVLVGKVFADAPNIPEYHQVKQAIADSGKSEGILRLGFVPSHHLSVIYSLATLYVQPSWYEGFGLPLLEAMKFGCPVASSDRGSLKEIGGEAVAYFDPARDMLEVISSLLRSPQRRSELAAAGLVQAAKFTWDKTAELTYKVYEQVLAARA